MIENKGLYKTFTFVARQEDTSDDGLATIYPYSTSAYKGVYKLQYPRDWDINKPIYVAVQSAVISGIPRLNQQLWAQCPRNFAIRSNSLSGAGNVIEAKRHRGDIDANGIGTAVVDFGDGERIPVEQSNLLALVPNTSFLNYDFDADIPSNSFLSFNMYKVVYQNDVDFTTCATRVPTNSSQTQIDLYITCEYDTPQNFTAGSTTTKPEFKLRTFNRLIGGTGVTPIPAPLNSSGIVGGGWDIVLKFFTPI